MPASARRYIAIETLISIAINTGLSLGFAWLFFGGKPVIAFAGAGGYGVDFLPQTFMITLMSVIVPTLLTRKRRAADNAPTLQGRELMPRRLLWRAPLAAIAAMVVLGGSAWILASRLLPAELGFSTLLSIKLAYGALVAALTTPLALIWALRDTPHASTSRRA